MLSPNVIIPFDGNHASIPSTFTRETDLDDRYPKAWGDQIPDQTGGASTHTHTSPSHSHTLNNHTHTYTSGARIDGGLAGGNAAGVGVIAATHTHTGTTGSSNGGTTSSDSVTYGAASNDPPYYKVIFIKAVGYQFIPQNGMILSEETSRNNMTFHAASAGKYLKGASTGANAGGTGGSTTNSHDISHTHTANSHTHADANTNASGDTTINTDGAGIYANSNHVHVASTAAGTQALNANADTLVTAETVEPAYKTLNAYKAASGNVVPEPGDIALWMESLSDIPIGWSLCDGTDGTPDMRNKFLKINSSAGVSTTGGSNTHTHAAQSHSHTSNGNHSHTISFGTGNNNNANPQPGATDTVRDGHYHASATSSSEAGAYASANTTANSSDNQPLYRTVAYIQLKFLAGGGALFALA